MARIQCEDLLHGAGLTQIAEHPTFTAINPFETGGRRLRKSFLVNNNIGVYLKYRCEPSQAGTYYFPFDGVELANIGLLADHREQTFIVLICATLPEGQSITNNNGDICALPYQDFTDLIERLRQARPGHTGNFQICVSCGTRTRFHVSVNTPGRRQTPIGNEIIVPRNAFPAMLFED